MEGFKKYVQSHDSKKGHFLDYWRSLRPTEPIYMTPIPKNHVGTIKGEDSIRLTGSPKFIATVISRLKEVIAFDTGENRLELDFRQSKFKKSDNTPSYILYIHLRQH